jgi:hypothetical protein
MFGPSSLLWPLTCAGGALFAPVDSAAGERAQACTAFYNPNGSNPNSPGEEFCLRTSAFHPNIAGNGAIFVLIRDALLLNGLVPSEP